MASLTVRLSLFLFEYCASKSTIVVKQFYFDMYMHITFTKRGAMTTKTNASRRCMQNH